MGEFDYKRAIFSECRNYRYTLWRCWQPLLNGGATNFVNFIMLNPSTADDTKDDNTIRKCVKFAKSWGYGGLCVTNLFAWRSTDPKALKKLSDPIGPENDQTILDIAESANLIVAAWSQYGWWLGRSAWARSMIQKPLHYLRMGEGKRPEPYHPLYLPDITKPQVWERK